MQIYSIIYELKTIKLRTQLIIMFGYIVWFLRNYENSVDATTLRRTQTMGTYFSVDSSPMLF